jgi:hypothetical protein
VVNLVFVAQDLLAGLVFECGVFLYNGIDSDKAASPVVPDRGFCSPARVFGGSLLMDRRRETDCVLCRLYGLLVRSWMTKLLVRGSHVGGYHQLLQLV